MAYGVMVVTSDFDSDSSGSNPDTPGKSGEQMIVGSKLGISEVLTGKTADVSFMVKVKPIYNKKKHDRRNRYANDT